MQIRHIIHTNLAIIIQIRHIIHTNPVIIIQIRLSSYWWRLSSLFLHWFSHTSGGLSSYISGYHHTNLSYHSYIPGYQSFFSGVSSYISGYQSYFSGVPLNEISIDFSTDYFSLNFNNRRWINYYRLAWKIRHKCMMTRHDSTMIWHTCMRVHDMHECWFYGVIIISLSKMTSRLQIWTNSAIHPCRKWLL